MNDEIYAEFLDLMATYYGYENLDSMIESGYSPDDAVNMLLCVNQESG